MKRFPERIIGLFEKFHYAELSTSDILKEVYSDEYGLIKKVLFDPLSDKKQKQFATSQKIKLHRKLLYYLNRLVADNVIRVSSTLSKGEKCFSLIHHSKFENFGTGISSQRAVQPLLHLENYKDSKIISLLDPQNWHTRLNAVLLEINSEDSFNSVYKRLNEIVYSVNDCVGIHGFEKLVLSSDSSSIIAFLKKIDLDSQDSDRRITLCIDLTSNISFSSFSDFIDSFSIINPKNVIPVFMLNKSSLTKQKSILKNVINNFSKNCIKIYVQHKDVHQTPILVGKAGTYTISVSDWQSYLDSVMGKTIGLCFSQVSVAVDVKNFFKSENSSSSFRQLLLKLSKSLVESSATQRKLANEYFHKLSFLNDDPKLFFRYSNNMIRLWNYDWEKDSPHHFSDLLLTCVSEINYFCDTQEIIFNSCGIPIRFRISLGSAFGKFTQDFFSKRAYRKLTIRSSADFYSKSVLDFLSKREIISDIFSNNDRLRFFRAFPVSAEKVLSEFNHLIINHSLPLFCYDFAKRKENLTLNQFIG